MSGVAFLLIVVVVSVIGSLIVWIRNRQPRNSMSSVGDFQREMQALGSHPPVAGRLEAQPRQRVNTVQVRPNEPAPQDTADEAADDPDAMRGDASDASSSSSTPSVDSDDTSASTDAHARLDDASTDPNDPD